MRIPISRAHMAAVGFTNKYFFNDKTSQTITVAASGLQNIVTVDTNGASGKQITYGQRETDITYSFSYVLNKKINSKNTFRAGANADVFDNNYADSALQGNRLLRIWNAL